MDWLLRSKITWEGVGGGHRTQERKHTLLYQTWKANSKICIGLTDKAINLWIFRCTHFSWNASILLGFLTNSKMIPLRTPESWNTNNNWRVLFKWFHLVVFTKYPFSSSSSSTFPKCFGSQLHTAGHCLTSSHLTVVVFIIIITVGMLYCTFQITLKMVKMTLVLSSMRRNSST